MYIDWDFVKIVLIALLALALVFGIVAGLDSWSCSAKTSGMGFAHVYSVMGGCKIEVESGKWIPLESYYFKQD